MQCALRYAEQTSNEQLSRHVGEIGVLYMNHLIDCPTNSGRRLALLHSNVIRIIDDFGLDRSCWVVEI